MIKAVFFINSEERYYKFIIQGHANYKTSGSDIVCAAVSSTVDMTIGAIKNLLKAQYLLKIDSKNSKVIFELKNKDIYSAGLFIKALCNHLINISKEYKDNVSVEIK